MLTQNFFMAYSGRTTSMKTGTNTAVSVTPTPTAWIMRNTGFAYFQGASGSSNFKFAVDVGFGDTAATLSDYDLADANFSNQKLTYIGANWNTHGNNEFFNATASFRNDGDASVTVKEIGLYAQCVNNYSSAGKAYFSMLSRKVLSTPITIAPGETYSFTYVVKS